MAVKFWKGTTTSFTLNTNWSDTTSPANGDTLIFNGLATGPCTADLGTALTTVTVIVEKSYAYSVGIVTAGVATYLVLDGGTLKMPLPTTGSPSGSARVFINFGSTAATVVIEDSATTGTESFYPPIHILGSAITATISGGVVGFAVRTGEAATLASLRTTKGSGTTPQVYLGSGITLTDSVLEAGTVYSFANNTTATLRIGGADYVYNGTGAHTTMHVDDGSVTYNGTGTITTLNLKAEIDFSGDGRAKTITTCNTYAGYSLNVDNGVPGGIIFTNAINHYDGISAGTLVTPKAIKGTLLNI